MGNFPPPLVRIGLIQNIDNIVFLNHSWHGRVNIKSEGYFSAWAEYDFNRTVRGYFLTSAREATL